MAERLCGIYKIASKIHPDRFYIGSGVDLARRWYIHKYDLKKGTHRNSRLQNHFDKYGLDDLSFFILETFDFISTSHLIEREQYYLDTLNPFFNIHKIADRPSREKRDPSVGEKISKALKGKPSSRRGIKTGRVPKTAFKKGEPSAFKGHTTSLENKEKMKILHTGNKYHLGHKQPPSAIKKIKEVRAKQVFSEESQKKKSESLKKSWAIRKANGYVSPTKGRKRESPSPEVRKKISDGVKRFNENKKNNINNEDNAQQT